MTMIYYNAMVQHFGINHKSKVATDLIERATDIVRRARYQATDLELAPRCWNVTDKALPIISRWNVTPVLGSQLGTKDWRAVEVKRASCQWSWSRWPLWLSVAFTLQYLLKAGSPCWSQLRIVYLQLYIHISNLLLSRWVHCLLSCQQLCQAEYKRWEHC